MPALEVQEVSETEGQPADAGQLCFQLVYCPSGWLAVKSDLDRLANVPSAARMLWMSGCDSAMTKYSTAITTRRHRKQQQRAALRCRSNGGRLAEVVIRWPDGGALGSSRRIRRYEVASCLELCRLCMSALVVGSGCRLQVVFERLNTRKDCGWQCEPCCCGARVTLVERGNTS